MIYNHWKTTILAALVALAPTVGLAEPAHDVPPGIHDSDPDWQRFRLGRDPLRSFESDAEGWRLEAWPGVVGLGEPTPVPAKSVDSRATDQERSLSLPVNLPQPTVAFKHASIGTYRYITYDVYVPLNARGRVRSLFFVKDKDGHWFQALSGRPFVKMPSGEFVPGPSSYRLVPGKWNTVTVDLRARSSSLRPQGHLARWQERFATETEYLGFAILGDDAYRGEMLLDNLRGWTLDGDEEALAIRDLAFPSAGVRAYDRFEATFTLNREFDDPFDPEVVRVDAVFTTPSGRERRAPGFLHQDYVRRLTVSGEQMHPKGNAKWTVRFAPRAAGRHQFKLEVKAGDDHLVTRNRSFEVRESKHPGYVRISKKDKRCLEFENGDTFYPIGHNFRSPNDPRCSFVLGWPLSPDEGTYTYDRILEHMAAGGENFVEIWLASWWVALEWTRDWKDYHGLGRYNLANAWRLDYLLSRARELGMRVQLVIDNHGKYSSYCDREWQSSPYNATNRGSGGFLRRPEQFFTDENAKRLYKQKVRYLFARWGWDPTIMGFEVISELDLTGSRHGFVGRKRGMDGEDAPLRTEHKWHKEMIAYFREVDSGEHLYTTHYSGNYDTVDPVMARLEEINYVVGDGYRGDSNPFARLAHASAVCHQKFGKPFIITEYGGGWNGTSDPALEADLHSGLWGTYMTSAAGSPLLWWFDFIEVRNLYFHFTALHNFASGEDRRDPELAMRTPAIERKPDDVQMAAMAYMSRKRGYAWVYAVETMSRYPSTPLSLSGVTLRFDDIESGTWKIELWNTVEGNIALSSLFKTSGNTLRLELPPFANDVALKLKRVEVLPQAADALSESTKRWEAAVEESRRNQIHPGAKNRVLGFEPAGNDRDEVKFVRGWTLLGPFSFEHAKWQESPAMEFVPNEANLLPRKGEKVKGVEWKPYRTNEGGLADLVNLDSFYKGGDSVSAYAVAELWSDKPYENLVLLVGSDDTVRVYINGKNVHSLAQARGASPDQDRIENMTLVKGRNLVIVKCGDQGGGWGFCLRFASKDGKPLYVKALSN